MSIEADQYVISIAPSIAASVMEAIAGLDPTHYLDKGADLIMVVSGETSTAAIGAISMHEAIFGENTIASVAVLPPGTSAAQVKAAIARGSLAPLEDPPQLIMLSPPDPKDPEITRVVDLMIEALEASAPDHAAYLKDAAKAYDEKYGTD
jgi:hypothetical protein